MKHLLKQKNQTPIQMRRFTKLWGLRYQIIHRKGNENVIVDALLRRVHGEFNTIIIMVPVWHKESKKFMRWSFYT